MLVLLMLLKHARLYCCRLVYPGVPSKLKGDDQVPYYYMSGSWLKQDVIPWNAEEKRAMTPAEGVDWLIKEASRVKSKKRERESGASSR